MIKPRPVSAAAVSYQHTIDTKSREGELLVLVRTHQSPAPSKTLGLPTQPPILGDVRVWEHNQDAQRLDSARRL